MLKKYGFSVIMWIPTTINKRLPLYEGLPTIENQRYGNVIANVSECILAQADSVFFGDAYATIEELDQAINSSKEIINIPVVLKKGLSDNIKNHLMKVHSNRSDTSSHMIRSSIRCEDIDVFNAVEVKVKDITIDNYKRLRYQGEVGIALKDMRQFDGVNVVGRCECNIELLENIKGGQKFKFVVIGEE